MAIHRVAIAIHEGVQALDVAGPVDVFAAFEGGERWTFAQTLRALKDDLLVPRKRGRDVAQPGADRTSGHAMNVIEGEGDRRHELGCVYADHLCARSVMISLPLCTFQIVMVPSPQAQTRRVPSSLTINVPLFTSGIANVVFLALSVTRRAMARSASPST